MISVDEILRVVERLWQGGDIAEVDLTVDLSAQTVTVTLRRHPFRISDNYQPEPLPDSAFDRTRG